MKRLFLFIIVSLVFVSAATAAATTVVSLDLPKLVDTSELIVVGEVVKVDARVENGRVHSYIDIAVQETWKGEEKETVRIGQIGGKTEELATIVHGMPSFQKDERVLLFLEKPKAAKHYVVTGLAQGKFSLRKQSESGEWVLKPKTENMGTVKPIRMPTGDVKLERAEADEVHTAGHSLADMKRRVGELLAGTETDPSSVPEATTK